jgi:hypothetical protein
MLPHRPGQYGTSPRKDGISAEFDGSIKPDMGFDVQVFRRKYRCPKIGRAANAALICE